MVELKKNTKNSFFWTWPTTVELNAKIQLKSVSILDVTNLANGRTKKKYKNFIFLDMTDDGRTKKNSKFQLKKNWKIYFQMF